jgi:hypothetical protein
MGTEAAKTTTENSETQDQTVNGANAQNAHVPTVREPGHRHSMNSLGGRNDLDNTATETNENTGGGR